MSMTDEKISKIIKNKNIILSLIISQEKKEFRNL